MKHVTVLRGGPSSEYDVSLRSGAAVLSALRENGYKTKDLVITKNGEWLDGGFVRDPEHSLDATDVVFIALHGAFGEDGQIQRMLQRKHIPFTGSRAFPSALAFNKELTKQSLEGHDILMAKHMRITKEHLDTLEETIQNILNDVGTEVFVKPITGGSSIGARYVGHEAALAQTLTELLAEYDMVMVEEYIRGREATVGVLHDFRDQDVYVLPVIEIIPPGGGPLWSYEDKYNGKTEEICPGRFSYHEKAKLSDAAAKIHAVLGCDHYSRCDFIVKDGEPYFLEINTLPGLTSESLFPKAAAAVGLEFKQLVRHLVETSKV
jgi:D-alanine-D-alanine ligase